MSLYCVSCQTVYLSEVELPAVTVMSSKSIFGIQKLQTSKLHRFSITFYAIYEFDYIKKMNRVIFGPFLAVRKDGPAVVLIYPNGKKCQ